MKVWFTIFNFLFHVFVSHVSQNYALFENYKHSTQVMALGKVPLLSLINRSDQLSPNFFCILSRVRLIYHLISLNLFVASRTCTLTIKFPYNLWILFGYGLETTGREFIHSICVAVTALDFLNLANIIDHLSEV